MASQKPVGSSYPRTGKRRQGKISVTLNQTPVPRLPHELDESSDSVGSVPRKPIQQAAEDIRNGLKDTDRCAETDKTYKKLKSER